MYRILQEEGIDLPRYAVLNRDPNNPEGGCNFLFCLFCTYEPQCFTAAHYNKRLKVWVSSYVMLI